MKNGVWFPGSLIALAAFVVLGRISIGAAVGVVIAVAILVPILGIAFENWMKKLGEADRDS